MHRIAHTLPPPRVYWFLIPIQSLLTIMVTIVAKRRRPVHVAGYLGVLLCSILALTGYLYNVGGHTNPLISLLLVPLAMSAALLGWQATTLIALTVLFAYTALTQFFTPLDPFYTLNENFMQLHLLGMWLTFLVSVLLFLVLVLPLALVTRAQQQLIAQQKEEMLKNEKIIAMATFATSAAHKLGTPLSTLAILTDDLQNSLKNNPEVLTDLGTMMQQIQMCKLTLHDMMHRADHLRNDNLQPILLDTLLNNLRQQFNLLHPDRCLIIDSPPSSSITIEGDETLELAFLNLLDNAARESQADPQLKVMQKSGKLCIQIIDQGPGIPEDISRHLGKPFNSSRAEGMGLGLFLSHSTFNRLQGTLRIQTGKTGTTTEVWLPNTELPITKQSTPKDQTRHKTHEKISTPTTHTAH